MAKKRAEHKRAIDSDVLAFLSEYVRYLLAAGMTWRRFSAIARFAFFNAAIRHARFENKRLNQSAVSAMTGLTRHQVRRFARGQNSRASTLSAGLDRLLDAWTSDPNFTNREFVPKPLTFSGRGVTFSALARKYGGDVPPRSLLRELQRHGCVSVRNGKISLRRTIANSSEEVRLRAMSKGLAELLECRKGVVFPRSPLQVVTVETEFPATSHKGRQFLKERAATDLRAYLMALRAAGTATAMEMPPEGRKASRTTRARIILVTEDVEE